MKKKNLLWALPAALIFTACGGGEESTETETTTDAEMVEETIAYGPFLSTEEVTETERIGSIEDYNAIEDKTTVIRYVSSAAKAPFPSELLDAYNLQVLAINVDGELPEELGQYQNLTTLCLGGNFTTIPESIGELENLKAVSFEYCKDLDLNQAIGVLANCPNLQYLNLAYMGLSELPANIGDLTNLKNIRLGSNPLATLPDSFYTLSNLTHVRLGSNEGMDYEGVITAMAAMPAVENLWLQYCGFETLPEVIGEFPSLTTVNWREEWADIDGDGIQAVCAKEGDRFENVDVSWNSMSGMFYDIY
ncbi:MAG: hypothetical protein MK078_00060 [Crocinitomicaceae bacterium]|nr:hypothetical protein [Crocinitomicaceae bacterium]